MIMKVISRDERERECDKWILSLIPNVDIIAFCRFVADDRMLMMADVEWGQNYTWRGQRLSQKLRLEYSNNAHAHSQRVDVSVSEWEHHTDSSISILERRETVGSPRKIKSWNSKVWLNLKILIEFLKIVVRKLLIKIFPSLRGSPSTAFLGRILKTTLCAPLIWENYKFLEISIS